MATQSQGTQFYISDSTGSPTVFKEITGVKDFTGPGGKTTILDASTLSSTAKEKLPGLPDEGSYSLTVNYKSGDAGQVECLAARLARSRRQFKVTSPADSQDPVTNPAQSEYFWGYVTGFTEKGGVDKIKEAAIDIEIDGPVTRV
jgi:hypothetical protein